MSDLVEFLLSRIAEDEAVARDAASEGTPPRKTKVLWTNKVSTTPGGERLGPRGTVEAHPSRVLAECEAKRRIIGIYIDPALYLNDDGDVLGGDGPETHWETLRHLAAVYADHPDYDEAWRP